jgi:glycosyltransferase involved in cell wall biosynthesis
VSKADRIIAVSNVTKEHLIHFFGISPDRVQTVYLGLSEHFRNPIPAADLSQIRSKYDLPERFFLYCGQIYPPKNFARLLRAFAEVGPMMGISLVVAGEHTWLCDDELALIDTLQLAQWVRRVGWVPHDNLPAFYSMAEALVMPSLYEACPSPPIEAMACSCPVITADRHGTKEVAGEAALLIEPENVQAIADAMRKVVTDSKLRQDLIAAGLVRQREFDWDKCARDTLRVLESSCQS